VSALISIPFFLAIVSTVELYFSKNLFMPALNQLGGQLPLSSRRAALIASVLQRCTLACTAPFQSVSVPRG
jgi:hypothetical protein